jgi:hypothetical protein
MADFFIKLFTIVRSLLYFSNVVKKRGVPRSGLFFIKSLNSHQEKIKILNYE